MTEKSIFDIAKGFKVSPKAGENSLFPKSGRYLWAGTQVFVQGENDFPKGSPFNTEFTKAMILQGGALAGWYEAGETLNTLIADMEMLVDEDVKTSFKQIQPGHGIVILREYFEQLSADEQRAVLEHETAHVVFNHKEGRMGIPCDQAILEHELEADAYAAKAVSKEAMAGAIVKMLAMSCMSLGHSFGLDEKGCKNYFKERLEGEIVSARIKALV